MGRFEVDNFVIRENGSYLFVVLGHSLSDCTETTKFDLKSADLKKLSLAIKKMGNHLLERRSFLRFLEEFETL